MGSFVIKARPDEDPYVDWSTVVDNATWVAAEREASPDGAVPPDPSSATEAAR